VQLSVGHAPEHVEQASAVFMKVSRAMGVTAERSSAELIRTDGG
jgi:hypothetical protein